MEGQNLKEDIPEFSGSIDVNCSGTVIYADGETADIHYLEEEYEIKLNQPGKSETWYKGKRFTFFVLFQLSKILFTNNKSNKVSNISDKGIFNEWGKELLKCIYFME